ncbi:MAG: TolC family protein [Thermodesulfobacteriota bacterium]
MVFLSKAVFLLGVSLFALASSAGAQSTGSLYTSETVTLSVEEARILALEYNKNILVAGHNSTAETAKALAERAAFDPVFELSGAYNKTSEPSDSSFISGGIKSERLSASSGITGQLPSGGYYDLFRFTLSRDKNESPIQSLSPAYSSSLDMRVGQNLLRDFGAKGARAKITAQSLRSDIGKLSLTVETARTLLDVERKYWDVVAAVRNYELGRRNLELGVDLLERNRVMVKEGVLPRLEEMKAESAVAARRVELIEAENDLKGARDKLKNLTGLPLETVIELTDAPETGIYTHTDSAELIETAFEKRAELKRAKKRLEMAETEKNYRANQRLPKLAVEGVVSLRGLAGRTNPSGFVFGDSPLARADLGTSLSDAVSTVADRDFVSWGASITMSVPIMNRYAGGLYRAATAEHNRSLAEYGRTKQLIALEVKAAADKLWSGYRRVEAATAARNVAEEVLEAEKEKYAAGLSTTREVLEAQRDLVRARAERIRSAADYRSALAALRHATGTIIEASGVLIEGRF